MRTVCEGARSSHRNRRLVALAALLALASLGPAAVASPPAAPTAPRPVFTPLMEAAAKGDLALVKTLVTPATINDPKNHTSEDPATLAAKNGHREVVAYLLEIGARPVWLGTLPPLTLAIIQNDPKRVEGLLKETGKPDQVDGLGKSPLIWAAEGGQLEVVKTLLGAGANPGLELGERAPLAQAALKRRHEVAEILIEALPGVGGRGTIQALKHLAESGDDELVGKLLKKGMVLGHGPAGERAAAQGDSFAGVYADPGKHCVLLAARNGHDAVLRRLLAAGVKVGDGFALVEASRNGHPSTAKLLLDSGARQGAVINDGPHSWGGMTAINWAAGRGDLEMVRLLRARGASLNPSWFDSPLTLAAAGGHVPVVKFALAQGAQLVTASHIHAVESAAYSGQHEAVRVLLEAGADKNRALFGAATGGRLTLVQWLVGQGADVNFVVPDVGGHGQVTILARAATEGRKDVVEWLLDHGANVNGRDEYGRTALMRVSRNGDRPMAERLLKRGADALLKSNEGRSALDEARESRREDLVKLLEEATGAAPAPRPRHPRPPGLPSRADE